MDLWWLWLLIGFLLGVGAMFAVVWTVGNRNERVEQ